MYTDIGILALWYGGNPLGAPSDWEAARLLTERVGIAGVPGSSFFRDREARRGSPRLRFAFCEEDETLREVARRLATLP